MSPSLPLGIALIGTVVALSLYALGRVCFLLGREVGRSGR